MYNIYIKKIDIMNILYLYKMCLQLTFIYLFFLLLKASILTWTVFLNIFCTIIYGIDFLYNCTKFVIFFFFKINVLM